MTDLPLADETGVITGLILDSRDQPVTSGVVLLTPWVPDVTTADPGIALPRRIHAAIGPDGRFEVRVLATDTMPGVEWWWHVVASSSVDRSVPRLLQVPTGATVDLAVDGRPVADTQPGRVVVQGPRGVGIAAVSALDGVATVTLTNGATHTIDLPPGPAGHDPVVGMDGDRLTVDGVTVGPRLTGPAGHSPVVEVLPDRVVIDGDETGSLIGPPVETSWEGTALRVGSLPPIDLRGPQGDPGNMSATGGPTPTRGAGLSSTGASLAVTRYTDGLRTLRIVGTATGTSAAVATVDAADRPTALALCDGWLVDAAAANAWPATISAAGVVTLLATPPAGTALSGTLEWRL